MSSFQKTAGALFIAARAGRGGGLLLLPFFLLILIIFRAITELGALAFRSACSSASNTQAAKADQRWL